MDVELNLLYMIMTEFIFSLASMSDSDGRASDGN